MLCKGDKTKQFIITTSAQVFSEKGYAIVTMKDICEACNLSRGGLYRYFGSTKEIFLEILNSDTDPMQEELKKGIAEKQPADQLFDYFLAQRKKAITGSAKGFAFAVYDFAFAEDDQRAYMNTRFKAAVKMLVALFKYGQETKKFKQFDQETMAIHIIYFLDNLATSSQVLRITDKQLTAQLGMLKNMII